MPENKIYTGIKHITYLFVDYFNRFCYRSLKGNTKALWLLFRLHFNKHKNLLCTHFQLYAQFFTIKTFSNKMYLKYLKFG